MRVFTMILIMVLMISAVLPMNVGLGLLFSPKEAAMKMNIATINEDVERAMLVLSAYILSWVVLYGLSLGWILKKKREGIWLALSLGVITFLRGVLLLYLYHYHGLEKPIVATIMLMLGTTISIFAFLSLRETRAMEN